MKPKKILFATMPLDGHFNPLTGIAMHLKNLGHDVRWYTGTTFSGKLSSLKIHHYPFKKALEINQFNMDDVFPERKNIKNKIAKLKFDVKNSFILRASEFYEDILELNKSFNFDLLVADIAFTGIPFVREKMNKPVVAIGVYPIMETSRDLAPNGLGMTPSSSFPGRKRQALLRYISDNFLFKEVNKLLRNIFDTYGIQNIEGNVFDVLYRKSTLVLQSGSPGFEYQRSDLSSNIHFIGSVLPYSKNTHIPFKYMSKLKRYEKVILVTQGTVEKDTSKILEPTLKAFAGSNYLVVATTGGSNTKELQEKYPHDNIIIEDFIPFKEVMPYCDAFVTNGGYGGVMLGIEHGLPLVASGIHEGKSEINARIGYFNLGINLNTEYPSVSQIKAGVDKVLYNPVYRDNVKKLGEELSLYNPEILTERYIASLFHETSTAGLVSSEEKHAADYVL